jgi:hypothetical protein
LYGVGGGVLFAVFLLLLFGEGQSFSVQRLGGFQANLVIGKGRNGRQDVRAAQRIINRCLRFLLTLGDAFCGL